MNSNDSEPSSSDSDNSIILGESFAAARTQQGLTQQQVADRLHLRISSIQAIESDGIEQGVSLTFTKGYVRLYAKLLGLPVEPALKAFDKLHAQDTQPAKLQSFSRRVAREANDSRWNMVTYIIVFAVIALVVIWWVDQSHFNFSDSFNSSMDTSAPETSEVVPDPTQQNTNESVTASLASQSEGLASLESIDSSSPDLFTAQTPDDLVSPDQSPIAEDLSSAALDEQASAVTNDVLAAADSTIDDAVDFAADNARSGTADFDNETRNLSAQDVNTRESEGNIEKLTISRVSSDLPYQVNNDGSVDMVFTFSDDCWVSVKDAAGETVAVGVKVKGRVMRVSAIPPVSIILGAPQYVAIDFGGQSIDMSEYDGSRSASFKLPIQGE